LWFVARDRRYGVAALGGGAVYGQMWRLVTHYFGGIVGRLAWV
jgi:hypothetical protein